MNDSASWMMSSGYFGNQVEPCTLTMMAKGGCMHPCNPSSLGGGGILTHRDTTSILHGPLAKSNGTTCHNVSNFLGVGNAPNITEHIQRSPCCRSLDKSKAAELWHIPLTPPATHEGCQIEKNTWGLNVMVGSISEIDVTYWLTGFGFWTDRLRAKQTLAKGRNDEGSKTTYKKKNQNYICSLRLLQFQQWKYTT